MRLGSLEGNCKFYFQYFLQKYQGGGLVGFFYHILHFFQIVSTKIIYIYGFMNKTALGKAVF